MGTMRIRTTAAALASLAGAALTAATLMAGPAGAATAGRQAVDGTAGQTATGTTTDITQTVGGSKTVGTVAFDQEQTVHLAFDVGSNDPDLSVGNDSTFTVVDDDTNGNFLGTICDNVPMHDFAQGDCDVPAGKLAVGVHHITAIYNGDADFSGSAAFSVLTVTKEPTSASLTTVPQVAFGQEGNETFTVTPAPRTSGTPTGNFDVLLSDGAMTFCNALPLTNGVGTCSLTNTALNPGSYQVTGFYDGDSTFSGSISGHETFTVTPGVASTTLLLSPSSVSFGQQQNEKMTVLVAPAGGGIPTGTVSIKIGTTTLCTEPVGTGTVTCGLGIDELPIGSYEVTASYSGDADFAASSSGQALLTISDKSPATPSLTLSPTKVVFGHEQGETLTASVAGSVAGVAPTGTVTVMAGTATVCTITLAGGNGDCVLAATKLLPGTYHLTAAYSGDVTYAKATAAASTALTVVAGPSATALKLSAAKIKSGHEQSEHLTVAVKPTISGSGTPAGKVTIKAGSVAICVLTLKKATGTCTLTAKKLRPGTYHLTATYAGASPFAGSVSARKTLTVTK
jgi:large repetitive protein